MPRLNEIRYSKWNEACRCLAVVDGWVMFRRGLRAVPEVVSVSIWNTKPSQPYAGIAGVK